MQATKPIPHGRLVVNATLHKIGEQEPYFSITAEEYDNRVRRENGLVSCGCLHDEIRAAFGDRFDDLIALHLSEMVSGAPMHAEANGWYWLRGAVVALHGPDAGEYHGASGSDARTPERCLAILAEHLRITTDSAQALADRVRDVYWLRGIAAAHAEFAAYVTACRPRWAREAGEAIAKHALTVTTR